MTKKKNPSRRRSQRRRPLRVPSHPLICLESAIDEAEVSDVHKQFEGYFTLAQVRDTLTANKDDSDRKAKTIRDLKYKRGKCRIGDAFVNDSYACA